MEHSIYFPSHTLRQIVAEKRKFSLLRSKSTRITNTTLVFIQGYVHKWNCLISSFVFTSAKNICVYVKKLHGRNNADKNRKTGRFKDITKNSKKKN